MTTPVGEGEGVERVVGDEHGAAVERARGAAEVVTHVVSGWRRRARRGARRAAAARLDGQARGRGRPVAPGRRRARGRAGRRRSARPDAHQPLARGPSRAVTGSRRAGGARRRRCRARQVREEQVVLEHERRPGGVRRTSRGVATTRRRRSCEPSLIGSSPASSRSTVVFPAPFGPSSATVSPGRDVERHVEVERADARCASAADSVIARAHQRSWNSDEHRHATRRAAPRSTRRRRRGSSPSAR